MEHTSGLADEGRQIHETYYPQRTGKWKEIDLGVTKIDFHDPARGTVHEEKNRLEGHLHRHT